ncbi:MAG: PEP-CTERM sorting domain-containing protein [Opitutales bacterium]|nr:PEP-CTERM sorting domain-containing protein [Opitutales bacterium]
MKKLSYLIISSIIASPLAFAANWEYDPDLPDENTKEELILTNTNYSIDTTGGVLTVTGNLDANSTRLSITGENNLVVGGRLQTLYNRTTLDNANLNVTGDINTMYGNGEIFVTGTSSQNGSGKWIFQSGGKLTLDENATLNAGNRLDMYFNASVNMGANSTLNVSAFQILYENETGFSFTMGDGATINASGQTIKVKNFTLGNNNTINANLNILNTFEVGQGTTINGNLQANDLIINKGASISGSINYANSLTVNSGASVKLADYFHLKNTITLNNAGTKAIYSGVEFWLDADSTLNIHLGNNSLAAVGNRENALVYTLYGKAGDGQTGANAAINVYLSDFVLGEDFVVGDTYKIALICSRYAGVSGWESIFNLVDDSAVADFVDGSLVHESNTWWVTVQGVAVPEPATYAAIFGALALAFAAYRRRK